MLLTRDGDGHTTFLQTGPSRSRDAIDAYLVTGETPHPNSVYENCNGRALRVILANGPR